MRYGEIFDVGGLHSQLFKLRGECFRAPPVCHSRIGRRLAIGHGGNGVGNTGVPKQPTLCVVYKVTIIDEIHRLADIDARRPARNVAGDAFAAIENVKFIDARLGLRQRC